MLRLKKHSLVLSGAVRVIPGVVVLLAVLWGSVPSSTLATGPMCTLACCAGRAPHAAGSCMNGSCHAYFAARRKRNLHHDLVQSTEQICGLPRPIMKLSRSGKSPRSSETSSSPDRPSIVSSTLNKPCASDCGAGTFSITTQRRPRETAALSSVKKSARQSSASLFAAASDNQRAHDRKYRRSNPRAPPTLVS